MKITELIKWIGRKIVRKRDDCKGLQITVTEELYKSFTKEQKDSILKEWYEATSFFIGCMTIMVFVIFIIYVIKNFVL